MEAIFATAFIVSIWIIGFSVLLGIGWLFIPSLNWQQGFWFGAALSILVLEVWNFIAPINLLTTGVLACLGAAGWLRHRPLVIAPIKSIAILIVLLLLIANISIDNSTNYDDGLYHFQSVMWANQFSIVPGLANLHSRLGYNSAYYLFAALFENLHAGSEHYTSGIFVFAVSLAMWQSFKRIRRRNAQNSDWLNVLYLVPLSMGLAAGETRALSNDFVIFLLGITLSVMIFAAVERRQTTTHEFTVILVLAALGLTIKLSAAVYGACAVLVALRYLKPSHNWVKWLAIGGLSGILLVGLWVSRNIVLSGYPFYISTILPTEVAWRVPREIAVGDALAAAGWARLQESYHLASADRSNWVAIWWQRQQLNPDIIVPIITLLISSLIWVLRKPRPREIFRAYSLYLLAMLVPLGVWFLTAPDTRFILAALWGLSLAVLVLATTRHTRRAQIVFTYMGILLLPLAISLLLQINTHGFGEDTLPTVSIVALGSGLEIAVPITVNGDRADQCWRTALPCSPFYTGDMIMLRAYNDLQSGFTSITLDSE